MHRLQLDSYQLTQYGLKQHELFSMVEYVIIGIIAATLAAIAIFMWRREH